MASAGGWSPCTGGGPLNDFWDPRKAGPDDVDEPRLVMVPRAGAPGFDPRLFALHV